MYTNHPQPVPAPSRGRGFVIAGSVLLALSVLFGIVGVIVFGGAIDFADFERDVAISGSSDRLVPGEIPFSVLEPLGKSDGLMTVGIATSDPTSGTDCSITMAEGVEVPLSAPRSGDELYDFEGRYGDFTVYGTARLEPGEYIATCTAVEQAGAGATNSFMVGRVLSVDDIMENVSGVIGAMGLWGLAALLFVIGLVLLIIGLVQRSRSKREAAMSGGWPGTGYPQPAQYPTSYGSGPQGPGSNGPGSYGPGSYGPGSYGPTGPGQMGTGPGGYEPGTQGQGGYGQPTAPQPMPPAGWGDPQQPHVPPAPAPAPREPWAPPPGWTPPGEQAPHGSPAPAAPNSPPAEPTPDDGASGWTVPPSKNT